ncbi:MAG: hypothetical protein IT349_17025 [Candidatus Eisenbacteria bacterium]|nr:hypothetical protein [Candidatus Eisenbacteria bacterium]
MNCRQGGARRSALTGILVRAALALVATLTLTQVSQAQLSAGVSGLTGKNAEGYLSPLPTALSSTLNTSIFQTGDVPKEGLNIKFGVQLMSAQFDDADRTYTAVYGPGDADEAIVPTVIGDTEAVLRPGEAGTQHYFSGGFDIDDFSIAVPQLTIGNLLGTRITARWIAVKLGDESEDLGDLELLGLGAQHSITQYIPDLPVDLAVGGFYQTFNLGDDLLETKALHLDVTGSKHFGLLQPYVGVGYDSFEMDLVYELTDGIETVDEISVDFEKETNLHGTVGLLANLPVVKAHIEFNLAAANTVALGLSFGN